MHWQMKKIQTNEKLRKDIGAIFFMQMYTVSEKLGDKSSNLDSFHFIRELC